MIANWEIVYFSNLKFLDMRVKVLDSKIQKISKIVQFRKLANFQIF